MTGKRGGRSRAGRRVLPVPGGAGLGVCVAVRPAPVNSAPKKRGRR